MKRSSKEQKTSGKFIFSHLDQFSRCKTTQMAFPWTEEPNLWAIALHQVLVEKSYQLISGKIVFGQGKVRENRFWSGKSEGKSFLVREKSGNFVFMVERGPWFCKLGNNDIIFSGSMWY